MSANHLEGLSVEELVARYAEAAIANGRLQAKRKSVSSDRQAEEIHQLAIALQRRGPEARRALLTLLTHTDPYVRYWAGAEVLLFEPQRALPVLRALEKGSVDAGSASQLAAGKMIVWDLGWLKGDRDLEAAPPEPPKVSAKLALTKAEKSPLFPVTQAEFEALLTQRKVSRVADELRALFWPSARLTRRARVTSELGISKLGGVPDVPAGMDWPTGPDGAPLAFIGQVRLSDMAGTLPAGELPVCGMMYFFYDGDAQPWGYEPSHRGSAVVIYRGEESPLAAASPPVSLPPELIFRPVAISASPEPTCPPFESPWIGSLGLEDREEDGYHKLLADLEKRHAKTAVVHRLLGHPDAIQGDMQRQCQMVSHGLPHGAPHPDQRERAAQLAPGAQDWRLLLQVDSDEKGTGMVWGSRGRLYFWIRREDLTARRFDRVWAVLQCT